jgi:chitosanase
MGVTASVCLLAPEDPGAGGASPDLSNAYRSQAAQDAEGAQGAKAWPERSAGAKSAEDKAVTTDLPPDLAAPAWPTWTAFSWRTRTSA